MSKPKYPGVNLNKAPTNKDFEFGKIAAAIYKEHSWAVNSGKSIDNCFSEKIAEALKKFRTDNKKNKKVSTNN